MNSWEKILLAFLLQAAENLVPIFVHSKNGIALVNASDPLVSGLVVALSTPTSAATQPPPVPAAA
jgi:hypothetical protein